MQPDGNQFGSSTSRELIDTLIRFGMIAYLVSLCFRVVSPFSMFMVWGLTLAIMLYPLHQLVAGWVRGRQGFAATVIVVVGFLLLGIPCWLIGDSLVGYVSSLYAGIEQNSLVIKEPGPDVAKWPVIGESVYRVWMEVSKNLSGFMKEHNEGLMAISKWIAVKAGGAVGSVAVFLCSLVIAGFIMTWGESGTKTMTRILMRISGPVKGPEIQALSVKTVRSVATGVLGVAFIQSVLFGLGFILAGVSGAGFLAVAVLLLGVLQLPTTIVALPVVIYLWSSGGHSTGANIFFTVYFVIAGLADNVLKPLLLGRGVNTPMPVILIGVLGGMVVGGFIGLFLGAVLLAVGYQIFMDWVGDGTGGTTANADEKNTAGQLPDAT